ncbi:MAG: 2-amino-4-hydroxy-6-hydroxymethyldihydropteridine diphosphokinase [Nitrospiria bacterium]
MSGKAPHIHLAYIGIGSNQGDRLVLCREAVRRLASEETVQIKRVSSLYETAPMGFVDQDWFYNAVTEIETTLSPDRLLRHSQEIEKQLGKRTVIPNGPRTIDLDILFYDREVIDAPYLIVPHPYIPARRFVLIPMVEIAPGFLHPTLHQRVESLLGHLNEGKEAKVIKREEMGWERIGN